MQVLKTHRAQAARPAADRATLLAACLAPALATLLAAGPALAQGGATATVHAGTYYVVSVSTGLALQPPMPVAGNNVFLLPFHHGGAQRWVLRPVADARTGKPTGRFTLQLDGAAPLYLQPYPVPGHTAIVGSARSASYQLRPVGGGHVEIRNHQLNGDALHAVPAGPLPTEAQLAPSDGSTAFQWDLVPAD